MSWQKNTSAFSIKFTDISFNPKIHINIFNIFIGVFLFQYYCHIADFVFQKPQILFHFAADSGKKWHGKTWHFKLELL